MTCAKKFSDLAPHQKLGIGAEHKVHYLLKYHGLDSAHVGRVHVKKDLIVNGFRVEVKCSNPAPTNGDPWKPVWFVNFHRHMKMSEDHVDYYIIRLVPAAFMEKRSFHLLFKSPVSVLTMSFTIHSLLSVHARNICAWDRLITEKKFPDFI